ncbi:MAG: hypothetical protein FD149_797 [Rhodospirillaceae bacterium]|nr:MAG: hypothetical protein FD149_797 [Rhodospirillaceae bacterium]
MEDTFSVRAHVEGTADEMTLTNLDGQINHSHITGTVRLRLTERPVLTATVAVDALDFSSSLQALPWSLFLPAPRTVLNRLGDFDASLDLHIGVVETKEMPWHGVTLKARLENGTLDIDEATITEAGGSGMIGTVRLSGLGDTTPFLEHANLVVRSRAPERLAVALPALPIDPAKLAPLAVRLTAQGDPRHLALTAQAEAGGGVATIMGEVDRPLGAAALHAGGGSKPCESGRFRCPAPAGLSSPRCPCRSHRGAGERAW